MKGEARQEFVLFWQGRCEARRGPEGDGVGRPNKNNICFRSRTVIKDEFLPFLRQSLL